jgi:GNAT superfamily N-acetyltransferase
MRNYPAVKVGRLGVNQKFDGSGVGSQPMSFIKAWFSTDNKTGCRFLLVDAYNEAKVLNYYQRNGFNFLLDQEDEIQKDKEGNPRPLRTRLMFFDLIRLVG